MKAPIIHIDPRKLLAADVDLVLMSKYDSFYRRIVEYVLHVLEGGEEGVLAVIVDGEGTEYEMNLPKHGYAKSLGKSLEYFEKIEEYETCDLIKQILNNL